MNAMNVSDLLNYIGKKAVVDVRTTKGSQLLFSGSSENFSKTGYVSDSCNTMQLSDIMTLKVSNYFIPENCNSVVIQTE